MENTNKEVVELQVKPSKNSCRLELTNAVNLGLYDALENPYYKAYYVSEEWDWAMVSLNTNSIPLSEEKERLWKQAKLVWDPSTNFSEKRVDVDWHAEKREVAGFSRLYGKDFKMLRSIDMDWVIVLSNWNFLMNKYGKYEPNLSFLNRVPEVKFERINRKELNFDEWSFSVVYWEFFISKKWTKCFRILPKEKAKHVLIRDDWWGAFEKYRWRTLPEDKATYYRRASSNWWWCWCDYWVYDVNFRNEVSEDDI